MSSGELKEDVFLTGLLRKADAGPPLPEQFTARVMDAVQAAAAEQAALTAPLISAKAWRITVGLLGALMVINVLVGLAAWPSLGRLPLPEPGWETAGLPPLRWSAESLSVGSRLLAIGTISLGYLLLDAWHGRRWARMSGR